MQQTGIVGQIDQICYVVDDIDAAVGLWASRWGAGPFFLMKGVAFPEWTWLGQPQDLSVDLAIGQLGDVQIEFIRPHSDLPSVYSHAMTGGAVLHHYGVLVDDLAAALARMDNLPELVTAKSGAGTAFAYVDGREDFGVILEMITRGEDVVGIFDMVRQATMDWDGTDPLRPLSLD